MAQLPFIAAIDAGIHQEMRRDPRVFVFGLDVDDHKAIQGSTRGLLEEFGADRVFGTPLSEDAMTGVAIGAARLRAREGGAASACASAWPSAESTSSLSSRC